MGWLLALLAVCSSTVLAVHFNEGEEIINVPLRPKFAASYHGKSWIRGPDSNLYQFHLGSQSWLSAREHCKSINSDLVAIRSEEQLQWILSHYEPTYKNFHERFLQVGLMLSEGNAQWSWLSGEALNNTLVPWTDGEPKDESGSEKCGLLRIHERRLDDVDCETVPEAQKAIRFVCERNETTHKEQQRSDNFIWQKIEKMFDYFGLGSKTASAPAFAAKNFAADVKVIEEINKAEKFDLALQKVNALPEDSNEEQAEVEDFLKALKKSGEGLEGSGAFAAATAKKDEMAAPLRELIERTEGSGVEVDPHAIEADIPKQLLEIDDPVKLDNMITNMEKMLVEMEKIHLTPDGRAVIDVTQTQTNSPTEPVLLTGSTTAVEAITEKASEQPTTAAETKPTTVEATASSTAATSEAVTESSTAPVATEAVKEESTAAATSEAASESTTVSATSEPASESTTVAATESSTVVVTESIAATVTEAAKEAVKETPATASESTAEPSTLSPTSEATIPTEAATKAESTPSSDTTIAVAPETSPASAPEASSTAAETSPTEAVTESSTASVATEAVKEESTAAATSEATSEPTTTASTTSEATSAKDEKPVTEAPTSPKTSDSDLTVAPDATSSTAAATTETTSELTTTVEETSTGTTAEQDSFATSALLEETEKPKKPDEMMMHDIENDFDGNNDLPMSADEVITPPPLEDCEEEGSGAKDAKENVESNKIEPPPAESVKISIPVEREAELRDFLSTLRKFLDRAEHDDLRKLLDDKSGRTLLDRMRDAVKNANEREVTRFAKMEQMKMEGMDISKMESPKFMSLDEREAVYKRISGVVIREAEKELDEGLATATEPSGRTTTEESRAKTEKHHSKVVADVMEKLKPGLVKKHKVSHPPAAAQDDEPETIKNKKSRLPLQRDDGEKVATAIVEKKEETSKEDKKSMKDRLKKFRPHPELEGDEEEEVGVKEIENKEDIHKSIEQRHKKLEEAEEQKAAKKKEEFDKRIDTDKVMGEIAKKEKNPLDPLGLFSTTTPVPFTLPTINKVLEDLGTSLRNLFKPMPLQPLPTLPPLGSN